MWPFSRRQAKKGSFFKLIGSKITFQEFLSSINNLAIFSIKKIYKFVNVSWLSKCLHRTFLNFECRTFLNLECETFLNLECGTFLNLECGTFLSLECGAFLNLDWGTFLNLECGAILSLECWMFLNLFWETFLNHDCETFLNLIWETFSSFWTLFNFFEPWLKNLFWAFCKN